MNLLKHPASRIWLLLMLATIATTWWLAKDGIPARVGTVGILLIAAYKVRLVLLHFMDLRHAPRTLRFVFETWLLVVTVAALALYLAAPAA